MNTPIVTLKEVAELLRVHPTTLMRVIRVEQLPHFKVGSDYRFDWEAVLKWTKERHTQVPSEPAKRRGRRHFRRTKL